MPESLEQLDLLLLTVPKTRRVHPDGIRFRGCVTSTRRWRPTSGRRSCCGTTRATSRRSGSSTRADFVCRAVCQELAGETVPLREIVERPERRRRELRRTIAGSTAGGGFPAGSHARGMPARKRRRQSPPEPAPPRRHAQAVRRTSNAPGRPSSRRRNTAGSASSATPAAAIATSGSATGRPASARRSRPATTPTGIRSSATGPIRRAARSRWTQVKGNAPSSSTRRRSSSRLPAGCRTTSSGCAGKLRGFCLEEIRREEQPRLESANREVEALYEYHRRTGLNGFDVPPEEVARRQDEWRRISRGVLGASSEPSPIRPR